MWVHPRFFVGLMVDIKFPVCVFVCACVLVCVRACVLFLNPGKSLAYIYIYIYIYISTTDISHDVVSVWYTQCFIFCQVDTIWCSKVRRYLYRLSVLNIISYLSALKRYFNTKNVPMPVIWPFRAVEQFNWVWHYIFSLII
jgi:hypothetical protein